MQPSRTIKHSLRRAKAFRKTIEQLCVYSEVVRRAGWADCAQGEERRFAANTATGCCVEVPLKASQTHLDFRCEIHSNDVLFGAELERIDGLRGLCALIEGAARVRYLLDVICVPDHSFSHEKAGCKVEVIPRRTHCDGNRSRLPRVL